MIGLLEIGGSFSGCKLLQKCGKGAYGIVYLAENAIGQKIIIKFVGTNGKPQRELQGVRYYMRVSGTHPNLLQIFHVGEMEEGFFYTMEAADDLALESGVYTPATLGNMIRDGKCFSPREAICIIRELLNGLGALHKANLVHRDIKPDNIIFVNGIPKLSDPGLVTEAGSQGTLVGTPGYIPPEIIADGGQADLKSDLYAIGKVFYCMVTGNSPREYPHLPETLPLEVRRQLFPVLCRMCNSSPGRRFSSVQEFLERLPEKLEPPTFLENKYKSFLVWRSFHREELRRRLMILAGLLLLGFFSFTGWCFYEKQEKAKIAQWKKCVRDFQLINQDRKELIPFQIRIMLPELFRLWQTQEESLRKAADNGDWKKAAQIAASLKNFLSSAAGKALPAVPEKSGDFAGDTAILGKACGFLTTPLYAYLPEDKKKEFQGKLSGSSRSIYAHWEGPRCGREWSDFQNYAYSMVFVPPGAVRMDHNKKIHKIPYHFWMGKNEVSHAHYTRMIQCSPQHSAHAGTPVERVIWNDVLYYCYVVTNLMKSNNTLPPGYIVRIPTEAEWEYAAKNAWLGKDKTPLSQRAVIRSNSRNRTWPGGSKVQGKLGINDIYGNVYEIVSPMEEPAMKHSVIIRGGSFRTTERACRKRIEYLKYQHIPYDVGFRIVVAPGDMSYFDREFFQGGSNMLRSHGRVFELLGENYGCFDWQRSEQLARLLNGTLAEPDSPELLHEIIKELPLAAGSWGCFIGGRKRNGKWHWISSGKEINFGKWTKSPFKKGEYLTLKSKTWNPETDRRSGIFLCQWDEKAFSGRNHHLQKREKLPLELLRFTIGKRSFLLVDSSMAFYTAKRFCELLGGRLACLDTPELREEVRKKLAPFHSRHILLGGYAKRDSFYWLTGEKITFSLLKNKDIPIPTVNRNFVTLKDGLFYNSQYSRLFLCEWSEHIFSSN